MINQIEASVEQFISGRITRRELVSKLTTIAIVSRARAAQEPRRETAFEALSLDHIALTVTDLERSREFYVGTLGMTVDRSSSTSCFLDFGDNFLALFRGSRPAMHHYCYSIRDYNVDTAARKLRSMGIEPRTEGSRIYFPDPDGLTVQLASS